MDFNGWPYDRTTKLAEIREGDAFWLDVPSGHRRWRVVKRVGSTGVGAYDNHGRFCWYHPSRVTLACRRCQTAVVQDEQVRCHECGASIHVEPVVQNIQGGR